MADNIFKTSGIIYEKPVRIAFGKKKCEKCNGTGKITNNENKETCPICKGKKKIDDPTKEYKFPSIILEMKKTYKDKEYTDLPEFELGRGVNIDDFKVGDSIDITFALSGKKISDTFHKTALKALYIKHSDLNYGVDVDTPQEQRENTFTPPNPYDKEDDDLPF